MSKEGGPGAPLAPRAKPLSPSCTSFHASPQLTKRIGLGTRGPNWCVD